MTLILSGTLGVSPVTPSGTSALVDGMTVGRGAGEVATNTAVGASALAANTTGGNNTSLGYQSLFSNTTNTGSTAFGSQAGYSSTVVVDAFGYQALYANTVGLRNVAFGIYSLSGNTTGNSNNAFGRASLGSNTTGSNNTAFGDVALASNTTASNNTAVGYQAAYSNTTGGTGTAVGYKAGYSNQTGSNNTFLGSFAGYLATDRYNTFVGGNAGYNSTGAYNTFVGAISSGGYGCAELMTTGSYNTILGAFNGNQGGLDIRTLNYWIVLSSGDGSPKVWYNGTNNYFYVPVAYAQTTAAAANLVVGSDGSFQRSTSALKYKQDIRDLEEIDINLLRPVRYKSNCGMDDQTKDHFGVVADEADAAGLKELVNYGADGEVEGFQYERLTVVLLKKLQMLEAEVKALKGQA